MPTNKQERERARRNLQQQLERRREAEARRRKTLLSVTVVATLVVIAAVVALVIGFTGGDSGTTPSANGSASASSTGASTTPAGFTTCNYATSGTASKTATVPAADEPSTGTVDVAVTTSQGDMTFQLDRSVAPCSVGSLVSLVDQKYYDSTPCHRLVTSGIFVLQCGDPTGTGTGGPGYTVPDEATGKEAYPAGTIAMARTQQANSTGSQFFIVYQDSPTLQQNLGALQYTVVGKVTTGLDVVTKVAAAGADTGTDGKPKLPIDLTTLAVTSDTSTASAAPSDSSAPATVSGSPSVTGTVGGSPAQ